MRYLVIQKYHDKYSVRKMCAFFNVSRSGYYDFLRLSEKEDKDKRLVDMILRVPKQLCKNIRLSQSKNMVGAQEEN